MKKLSPESKNDIRQIYNEIYCIPTTITSEGVAVAEHFEEYLNQEE